MKTKMMLTTGVVLSTQFFWWLVVKLTRKQTHSPSLTSMETHHLWTTVLYPRTSTTDIIECC